MISIEMKLQWTWFSVMGAEFKKTQLKIGWICKPVCHNMHVNKLRFSVITLESDYLGTK